MAKLACQTPLLSTVHCPTHRLASKRMLRLPSSKHCSKPTWFLRTHVFICSLWLGVSGNRGPRGPQIILRMSSDFLALKQRYGKGSFPSLGYILKQTHCESHKDPNKGYLKLKQRPIRMPLSSHKIKKNKSLKCYCGLTQSHHYCFYCC